jgi:beta-ureidopropionase / N-carbamoyl-L-amino-acid hydrolase
MGARDQSVEYPYGLISAPSMSPSADLAARVSDRRLSALLGKLATFGARAEGGVNRQALTPADVEARAFLAEHAAGLGCTVSLDKIGNLFMRRAGTVADAPVATGSHIDTQPAGGTLDGAYGVCAGLEVIAALNDARISTRHPIEVVAWSNEEGCRFSPGSLGAQAFVEPHRFDALAAAQDRDGVHYADELTTMRRRLAHLPDHPLGAPMQVFVEAHIEQGPVLEQAGVPVGIVAGVQGVRWFRVHVTGRAAHAGTTPLPLRRDALRAANALLAELYAAADRSADLRLTVGRIDVAPASINTVPGHATITVDMRHTDPGALDMCEALLRDFCSNVRHGCTLTVEPLMRLPTIHFNEGVCESLGRAAQALRLPSIEMLSGAFHDAVHLAAHCPTGMLFVPSRDGVSHHPDEYTAPSLLASGARVLALVLASYAEVVGTSEP